MGAPHSALHSSRSLQQQQQQLTGATFTSESQAKCCNISLSLRLCLRMQNLKGGAFNPCLLRCQRFTGFFSNGILVGILRAQRAMNSNCEMQSVFQNTMNRRTCEILQKPKTGTKRKTFWFDQLQISDAT